MGVGVRVGLGGGVALGDGERACSVTAMVGVALGVEKTTGARVRLDVAHA
jgi:hypothetical protein